MRDYTSLQTVRYAKEPAKEGPSHDLRERDSEKDDSNEQNCQLDF